MFFINFIYTCCVISNCFYSFEILPYIGSLI